jgi:hypothetical protein
MSAANDGADIDNAVTAVTKNLIFIIVLAIAFGPRTFDLGPNSI